MTEIKNVIADAESISVTGQLQVGDITYIYENSQHKVYFEKVEVDSETFKGYISPVFARVSEEKLEKNRILFLGGGHNFNTNMFMKFLAHRSGRTDTSLNIKESMGLPDAYSLLHAIQKESTPCVFLIYRATPESLEYNFNELKKIISAGKHYILISTYSPKEAWQFNTLDSEDLWHEIPARDAYVKDDLIRKMMAGIQERKLVLPNLVNLAEVSLSLGVPENIEMFIEKLAECTPVTTDTIHACLTYASPGDASGIVQWFHNLQHDQKLIVLGLALFSGLREIQFFDAMDMLIEEGWSGRSHRLKQIDYHDILPLLSYFKIDNGYVVAKYPEQTPGLLGVAWKTHRRFIDAALPILIKLVMQSASETAFNWKLFGNQWLRHIVRQVITASLTSLGKVDFPTVEYVLLSLASSEQFDARMVAAETLANLRPDLGDKWYETIETWQNKLEIQDLISHLKTDMAMKEEKAEDVNAPIHYIQATIAAALGAVAQKESVNGLDRRVLEQVKRMARLRNKLVVKSVQHTLRLISARHTSLVSDSLREDFLIHTIFIQHIAAGLADGYNNLAPLEVKKVLFQWIDDINQNPAQRKKYLEFIDEDKVLCCIILTFQLIDYHITTDGKITLEEAYETLDFLRRHNHQPVVRDYLLKAMVALIKEYLRNPSNLTINYISNLDEEERDKLVKAFRYQYLVQRKEQEGGDYRMRISNQVIPVWVNESDRPKTNIERLMKEWLNYPDESIQQIAALSMIKFTEVEDQEKLSIDAYLIEQSRIPEIVEEPEELAPDYNAAIAADALTYVFVKIASRVVQPSYMAQLQHIAPVLIRTDIISDVQLLKILSNFDDPNSNYDETVPRLIYLYNLFKGKNVNPGDNPFRSGFWARQLVAGKTGILTVSEQHRLAGWAPILIQQEDLRADEIQLILSATGRLGSLIATGVWRFRFFYFNKWIWWVLGGLVLGVVLVKV